MRAARLAIAAVALAAMSYTAWRAVEWIATDTRECWTCPTHGTVNSGYVYAASTGVIRCGRCYLVVEPATCDGPKPRPKTEPIPSDKDEDDDIIVVDEAEK